MSHPIVERLRSPRPDERISACRAAVEDPSAILLIDALGSALGDPIESVALAASDALAQLARDYDEVANVVRGALRSGDASQRWHAALTSARIEPPTPRLLPAIVEALKSPGGDVRWTAARLLVETGRLHPEALSLAIGLAKGGESTQIRRMAMHCLRELAPDRPEVARTLLDGSRDPDRSVRRAALTALAAIRDPQRDIFDRLLEVIADPSDVASRLIAARSLEALVRDEAANPTSASIAALEEIARADLDAELRPLLERALEHCARSSQAPD